MKKILLILTVICYGFHTQAEIYFKSDSVKINKQITKLQLKLINLKTQLIDTQNKLPLDSAILSIMLQQSHNKQVKSKKKSEQAVGGNVSDAEQAEKEAKDAEKQTQKTEEDAKQVEQDRKKIKELINGIEKKQEQLNKIQTQ